MRNGYWRFGVLTVLALMATTRAKALINGEPAAPADFSEVMLLTSDRPNVCSSVLVGPNVILTAASCVKTEGKGSVTVDGHVYHATFTLHPQWPSREYDLALGVLDRPVTHAYPVPVGGQPAIGDKLTLAGYGCTDGEAAHFDHVLRVGEAAVTDLREIYAITGAGAQVCYRDNGGPAYLGDNVAALLSFGDRHTKSYLVRLDTPETHDFLLHYAVSHDVAICGINHDCDKK